MPAFGLLVATWGQFLCPWHTSQAVLSCSSLPSLSLSFCFLLLSLSQQSSAFFTLDLPAFCFLLYSPCISLHMVSSSGCSFFHGSPSHSASPVLSLPFCSFTVSVVCRFPPPRPLTLILSIINRFHIQIYVPLSAIRPLALFPNNRFAVTEPWGKQHPVVERCVVSTGGQVFRLW